MENMLYAPVTNAPESVSLGGNRRLNMPLPNNEMDKHGELESIVKGATFAAYYCDYMVNTVSNFKAGKVYSSETTMGSDTMTFYYKAVENTDGISADTLTVAGDQTSQISVYFKYDYTNNRPLETAIFQPSLMGAEYGVTIAKFDYVNEVAYDYTIVINAEQKDDFVADLNAETAVYDEIAELDIIQYTIAKIDLKNETSKILSLKGSNPATDGVTADQLKTLYNDIYASVKAFTKPKEPFATQNAENFESYLDMYQYSRNQSACLVHEGELIKTTVTHTSALNMITKIKTALTDAKYDDDQYDGIKETIDETFQYLSTLPNKEFMTKFNPDGLVGIGAYEMMESVGLVYKVVDAYGTWDVLIHCENEVAYDDYLEVFVR